MERSYLPARETTTPADRSSRGAAVPPLCHSRSRGSPAHTPPRAAVRYIKAEGATSNVVLLLQKASCSLNLRSTCTLGASTVAHWHTLTVPVHRHPIISYLRVYGIIHGNWIPDGIKQSYYVLNVSADQWCLCIQFRSRCRDTLLPWEDCVERLALA